MEINGTTALVLNSQAFIVNRVNVVSYRFLDLTRVAILRDVFQVQRSQADCSGTDCEDLGDYSLKSACFSPNLEMAETSSVATVGTVRKFVKDNRWLLVLRKSTHIRALILTLNSRNGTGDTTIPS